MDVEPADAVEAIQVVLAFLPPSVPVVGVSRHGLLVLKERAELMARGWAPDA